MSFVTAAPEMLATAAQNVANIGTSLSAANATAAASTTSVLAAGADEVSQAIARLFSDYATHYQSLNAQAAAFHHSFVQTLNAAGGAYSSAEAANASAQALEQNLLAVINAPAQALFGRPLIGNGANGTAASPNGCPGAVPCAPSPISGRPSSVWVGAFTAPSTTRIAAALAISVAVYHLAAAVSVCTNWS